MSIHTCRRTYWKSQNKKIEWSKSLNKKVGKWLLKHCKLGRYQQFVTTEFFHQWLWSYSRCPSGTVWNLSLVPEACIPTYMLSANIIHRHRFYTKRWLQIIFPFFCLSKWIKPSVLTATHLYCRMSISVQESR